MIALRTGARALSILIVFQVLSATQVQAASCSDQAQTLHGPVFLATSTYYARPGQENAIYQGLVQQNQQLTKNGVEAFTLLRGRGGTGPAAEWQMTFPTMAAHDAWLKQADKVLPAADSFNASILRAEHRHYKIVDGWTYSPCK